MREGENLGGARERGEGEKEREKTREREREKGGGGRERERERAREGENLGGAAGADILCDLLHLLVSDTALDGPSPLLYVNTPPSTPLHHPRTLRAKANDGSSRLARKANDGPWTLLGKRRTLCLAHKANDGPCALRARQTTDAARKPQHKHVHSLTLDNVEELAVRLCRRAED